VAAAEGGHGAEGGMPNPMHQFEIERYYPLEILGIDVSFTNSSFFMVLGLVLLVGFLLWAMSARSIVPSRMQSVAEVGYEYIMKMVTDSMGESGKKFFPLIFTIFMFILTLNLLGMINIPGVWTPFTVTSHIIVTFALAAFVFLLATAVGFWMHGLGYLQLFVPHGVPWPLLLVITPIEVISYFIRPISLSVRLFANMMAGHTLLKVFGGFVVMLGAAGIVPLIGMVAFTGLEMLVAFLQALIFSVLSCIYLNEAIHMHEH
jgi:F-type H+-transporting ATPase subunit a